MLLRTVRVHAVRAFSAPTPVYSTSGAGMASSLCLTVNNVFLLLIFIQLCLGPVFISPSDYCLKLEHGELFCDQWYSRRVDEAKSAISINNLLPVFNLGLYISMLLVGFAWLSILLATYAKDRGALRCSLVCQALSSLLIFINIIAFLLHWIYMGWKHVPLWFYIRVGVQIQLVIATALTRVSERRLTSDWESKDPNDQSPSPCQQMGNLNMKQKCLMKDSSECLGGGV